MTTEQFISKVLIYLKTPFTLSIVISSLIILFLLPPFNKYKAELEETINTEEKRIWYYDLDNDNYSEKITYSTHRIKGTIITVHKTDKIIDQWNFNYPMADFFPSFGDYDANGYSEIYIFTRKNDSIFINWFEPANKNNQPHSRFINRCALLGNKADIGIFPCTLSDINNDGFKEYSFIINAGFVMQPRNLFLYDIKNDTIYTSPQSGEAIRHPVIHDLNSDNFPEILVNAVATGNYPEDTTPYTDRHCWLMAFSSNTQFLFEPVRLGEYPSNVITVPFSTGKATRIAALYRYAGTKKIESYIGLWSAKGELLKKRNLGLFNEQLSAATLLSADPLIRDRLYLVFANGSIEQLDSNLETINTFKVPGVSGGLSEFSEGMLDIDLDGQNELFFMGKDKIIITRSDFSHPLPVYRPVEHFTLIFKGKEKPELFLADKPDNHRDASIFTYSANPFYYLKVPLYLAIFAFTYAILFFGRKYYIVHRKVKKSALGQYITSPPQQGDTCLPVQQEGVLPDFDFTRREKEILRLLAVGKTSWEIADELHISKDTVDTHRRNILKKSGYKSITKLINTPGFSRILNPDPLPSTSVPDKGHAPG